MIHREFCSQLGFVDAVFRLLNTLPHLAESRVTTNGGCLLAAARECQLGPNRDVETTKDTGRYGFKALNVDLYLGGYIGVTSLGRQRPNKAELVTIRVGQVKETLAPFGISRGRVRPVPCRDYAPIERINVRIVEDHSSPPGPMPLGRLGS